MRVCLYAVLCTHCTAKQLERMMVVKEAGTFTVRTSTKIFSTVYSLHAHVCERVCKRRASTRTFFLFGSYCIKAKSED